ncbi:hypothetical protein HDU93_001878, partial [Gonapodya sp. JEL0774]
RSTINPDDVKLLVRRNPDMLRLVSQFANENARRGTMAAAGAARTSAGRGSRGRGSESGTRSRKKVLELEESSEEEVGEEH